MFRAPEEPIVSVRSDGDAMLAFPQPQYMPCGECGASVARAESDLHHCEPERRVDFLFLQLRGEREQFDKQLTTYLESPRGLFEVWYAARHR
jgi:hypothetical protein